MQIRIRTQGFSLSEALRGYTERRLRFSLACAAERIGRVEVALSDINGPRGGIDKRCRIRTALTGLDAIVAEDTQADLYLAIDRASARLGRTVVRRLTRPAQRSEQGMKRQS